MGQPLLEGQTYVNDDAREVIQLTAKVARLEGLNRQLEEALRSERMVNENNSSGTRALREILTPLYRALQKVFGELDEVIETIPVGAPQFNPQWKAWQDKLGQGTAPARVIGALLDHGPLTRAQLRQAAEMGWSTLDGATARLKNLQLIEKSGDRWNLKG